MAKLITLVVANRAIMDKQNNNVSLIDLLQGLQIGSPVPNAPRPPRNMVVPKEWAVFTFWKPDEGDSAGQTFSVITRVLWPDGNEFNRAERTFQFDRGKNHISIINLVGFPAGQEGRVEVITWLDRDSRPATEKYTWSIDVAHNFPLVVQ